MRLKGCIQQGAIVAVSLQNMSFGYSGNPDEPILRIPSWKIERGEQVFLHGPSGSGKSTLLNILGGTLTTDDGSVSILGQDLKALSSKRRDRFRATNIGYVFQQFNLIPYLSALDNILLAAYFARPKWYRMIDSKNTQAAAKELLTQLHVEPDQWFMPVSELSVGQQQRVAISRALINNPNLLIVDEPTSSLDHNKRDAFMALLFERVKANNITLVFVSHDVSLARLFPRVDAMKDINRVRGVS